MGSGYMAQVSVGISFIVKADFRVVQGPGGADGLFGGLIGGPHLLDFGVGLEGLVDEGLQIRG